MSTFAYKARTKEGEARSGVLEAPSQEVALDRLQQSGLIILNLQERKTSVLLNMKFGSGVRQKDLVLFSRQLATLFEAQIPVLSALKTMIQQTSRPALRSIAAQIADDVAGGSTLSQTLSRFPHVFSPFYVSLIRSAEETGKLQDTFSYIADYLERTYALTTKARNSMIYPIFVLFVLVVVFSLMLTVVIPKLSQIFAETGQPLPIYTRMIIGLSSFVRQWGIILIFIIIAGAIAVWRWGQTPEGRYALNRLQLRVPILGNIYQKIYMARFSDNLRVLIAGGIPVLRALAITKDVVGNAVYQDAIERAIESVKAGNNISEAMERTKEIPPMVINMIRVGETSGRLEFILGNIARYYQREVDSLLDNLVALIEPILIIALGLGVGIMVASVLVPLYNIAGSI